MQQKFTVALFGVGGPALFEKRTKERRAGLASHEERWEGVWVKK